MRRAMRRLVGCVWRIFGKVLEDEPLLQRVHLVDEEVDERGAQAGAHPNDDGERVLGQREAGVAVEVLGEGAIPSVVREDLVEDVVVHGLVVQGLEARVSVRRDRGLGPQRVGVV